MRDEFESPADQLPDIVVQYLGEIGQVPLLTADQEFTAGRHVVEAQAAAKRLAATPAPTGRARLADERAVANGDAARGLLITSNLRLVVSVARRYRGHGMALMDLIQEGNIGLMRSVEKYDYTKGHRFSTYATWWIRQAVTRAIADQGRTIRLPVHMGEAVSQLLREEARFKQCYGRPPDDDELAELMGLSVQKVQKIIIAYMQGNPQSLDEPLRDEEGSEPFGNFLPAFVDVEDEALNSVQYENLHALIRLLPQRERRIIELRYGLNGNQAHTLEQVGKALGMTRERARQIEADVLRKLRHPDYRRKIDPDSGLRHLGYGRDQGDELGRDQGDELGRDQGDELAGEGQAKRREAA